jgi:hypothetical protein
MERVLTNESLLQIYQNIFNSTLKNKNFDFSLVVGIQGKTEIEPKLHIITNGSLGPTISEALFPFCFFSKNLKQIEPSSPPTTRMKTSDVTEITSALLRHTKKNFQAIFWIFFLYLLLIFSQSGFLLSQKSFPSLL